LIHFYKRCSQGESEKIFSILNRDPIGKHDIEEKHYKEHTKHG